MEIEYNGKTYIWDETKEWWEQEEETQKMAAQIISEITNEPCILQETEQTGSSFRITYQEYKWNGLIVGVRPLYMYPKEHEKNGQISKTSYTLRYEQI